MTTQSVDLSQCFHDETGVIMINKIAHAIDCIEPGAIGILIFQNEIQISFSSPPIIVIGKDLRSAGQQKGAVRGGVNHSAFVERGIGTTAGILRRREILDVKSGMPSN